jgi:microcystin-dependent protein
MSEPFLGQITLFPYNFAPNGWQDCDGQLLPISQFSALFSLLGTNYGGNGTSNFALPNLQGSVTVGQGQLAGGSDYVIGEAAGSENVTVIQSDMAAHNHTLGATTSHGTTSSPAGAVLATGVHGTLTTGQDKLLMYSAPPTTTTLAPTSLAPAGGSQPHNNVQPSLGLRYCIAMVGVFPSRG